MSAKPRNLKTETVMTGKRETIAKRIKRLGRRLEGKSIREIADYLGSPYCSVYVALRAHPELSVAKIHKANQWTPQKLEELKKLYEDPTATDVDFRRLFGIKYRSAVYQLRSKKIKCRRLYECTEYTGGGSLCRGKKAAWLKANWKYYSVRTCAIYLGCTTKTVYLASRKLGLPYKREPKYKPQDPLIQGEKVEWLKDNWKYLTAKACAAHLGCSSTTVYRIARRLCLPYKKRPTTPKETT